MPVVEEAAEAVQQNKSLLIAEANEEDILITEWTFSFAGERLSMICPAGETEEMTPIPCWF
jgi:hypothetical protein